jgi:hypothetical protein
MLTWQNSYGAEIAGAIYELAGYGLQRAVERDPA